MLGEETMEEHSIGHCPFNNLFPSSANGLDQVIFNYLADDTGRASSGPG